MPNSNNLQYLNKEGLKRFWEKSKEYIDKTKTTESEISGFGFTKNTGTITGITMNGVSKGTSGVVNLGTVITSHQDISGKLDKTTNEYNKEVSFGSSGKLFVGSFPMYDSNVTIEFRCTTSVTYNATLIIATQNCGAATGGGHIKASVYGDPDNSITSSISIFMPTIVTTLGYGWVDVYFNPSSHSKNLIHIKCSGLKSTPSSVCSSVSSIPTSVSNKKLVTPTNMLTTTFASKDVATSESNGLLSSSGWEKLQNIEDGANRYVLPNATSSTLGGIKVGSNITLSSGTISLSKSNIINALGYTPPEKDTDTTYTIATQSANGLMSSSDKIKLDNIEEGANNYTLPIRLNDYRTTSSNINDLSSGFHYISNNTTTNPFYKYHNATPTFMNTSISYNSENGSQIATDITTNRIAIRNKASGSFGSWNELLGESTHLGYVENNKNYPVEKDSTTGKLFVNVPWVDSKNTIDSALSTTSTNPVQNKIITNELNLKLYTGDFNDYKEQVTASLSGKQDTITGGATTITSSNLTASRALVSNSDGKVAVSAVTSTELGYLDGVTSAIQTQLNNKVSKNSTGVQTMTGGLNIGGTPTAGTGVGRLMLTGNTNPLIGLQAIDSSGNKLTPYYFQISNNKMYLGPTSAKALAFDSNGNATIPATLSVTGAISEGGTALSNKYSTLANTIKSLSISGKTITYTKGDDTTGTLTTQDTTYSAAGSSLGLVKSGGDVTISSGVITVNDDSHNHTLANIDGLVDELSGVGNLAQTAINGLDNKVDKVSGKALSTNDYTTTEKNKLAGIEAGANKITVDSSLSTTSTNPLQNKIINTALSEKMPLSGGKFTGKVSFSGESSLPSKTLQYILGIDAFASGGEMGWQASSSVTVGSATKATKDANGNVINSTYATKEELSSGLQEIYDSPIAYLQEDVNTLQSTKQDNLISGTSIKTINGNSLLGSGNITINTGSNITVDSSLSTTSTNPVQNKVITSDLANKLDIDDFTSFTNSLNTTLNNKANKEYGVYFVDGSSSTTTGTWIGTSPDITSYYDGLVVNYKVGVAGASTTKLNINGLGAKTCYLRGDSKITTHYAVGTMVLLSYNATTDAFYSADYDANTNTYVTQAYRSTSEYRPLLLSAKYTKDNTSGSSASSSYWTNKIYANPNTGALYGTTLYENGTSLSEKYQAKGDYAPLIHTHEMSDIIGLSDSITGIGNLASGADFKVGQLNELYNDLNDDVANLYNDKQDNLVSGINIKTINGQSILGNGDITIEGGSSGGESDSPAWERLNENVTLSSNVPIYFYTNPDFYENGETYPILLGTDSSSGLTLYAHNNGECMAITISEDLMPSYPAEVEDYGIWKWTSPEIFNGLSITPNPSNDIAYLVSNGGNNTGSGSTGVGVPKYIGDSYFDYGEASFVLPLSSPIDLQNKLISMRLYSEAKDYEYGHSTFYYFGSSPIFIPFIDDLSGETGTVVLHEEITNNNTLMFRGTILPEFMVDSDVNLRIYVYD